MILILTILSSDGIVSAQEFFTTVENDFVNAFPLNKCISKDSNSMIYRFYNGTHAVQKIFAGSVTCDESKVGAQYFMEGYYTDIQRLINAEVLMHYYKSRNNISEAKKYAKYVVEHGNDLLYLVNKAKEIIDSSN